ncbi:MAG: hypothetical protein PHT80_00340 [Lentisphaeria bacterium]|nr:hypothetical protein [Lentisphaeria bacterium]
MGWTFLRRCGEQVYFIAKRKHGASAHGKQKSPGEGMISRQGVELLKSSGFCLVFILKCQSNLTPRASPIGATGAA